MTDLFWQLFPNFYETPDTCEFSASCGSSRSDNGASPDQAARITNFHSLFGVVPSGDNLQMIGLYLDDLATVRLIGAHIYGGVNDFNRVQGIDFDWSGSSSTNFAVGGTFLVRSSVVPLPAAVWLFISALGGLGFFRRRYAS